MRRFLLISIISLGLIAATPLVPLSASGTTVANTPAETRTYEPQQKRLGPCNSSRFDVRPAMGGEKIRRRMEDLIACAVERWPVPGGLSKALDVAYCESGDHLWPWAHYDVPGDDAPFGCSGVFQHNTKYWTPRVREFLRPGWFTQSEWRRILTPKGAFNPRANVLISIQMAHRGGWGPWSCA